jgi:hypothetical protein
VIKNVYKFQNLFNKISLLKDADSFIQYVYNRGLRQILASKYPWDGSMSHWLYKIYEAPYFEIREKRFERNKGEILLSSGEVKDDTKSSSDIHYIIKRTCLLYETQKYNNGSYKIMFGMPIKYEQLDKILPTCNVDDQNTKMKKL